MSSTIVPIEIGKSKPYLLEISTHSVPMRGLPEALEGKTFVHLSDLHGGFGHLEAVYEEAISRVNALQPDLILFTGDYVDDHAKPHDYPMWDYLKRFQARLGVYGCFGNHEHRRGIEKGWRVAEKAGIHILNNASVRLESGLWLAGIDDLHEGAPDIPRALAYLPDDQTSIVLSHNPRLLEQLPDRDILILSGHTHGSQIVLPFLPAHWVTWFHLRCPQVAGWYTNGQARLYVNRGLGVTGQPFRYRCPAEIGVFHLEPQRHRDTEDSQSKTEEQTTEKHGEKRGEKSHAKAQRR